MKVRTNLSSEELELVAKGLRKMASKQRTEHKFTPANPAEEELVKDVARSVEHCLDSLAVEISALFTEDSNE